VPPTRAFPSQSDRAHLETASEQPAFRSRIALEMCRVRSSPACRTERPRSPEQPQPEGQRPAIVISDESLTLQDEARGIWYPDGLSVRLVEVVSTALIFGPRVFLGGTDRPSDKPNGFQN